MYVNQLFNLHAECQFIEIFSLPPLSIIFNNEVK